MPSAGKNSSECSRRYEASVESDVQMAWIMSYEGLFRRVNAQGNAFLKANSSHLSCTSYFQYIGKIGE